MDRLLKLLRDNARNRTASTPKAKAEESGEATLYLYDVIVSDDYWGGVAAEAFVKELNATAAPTIHLRINSPGGEVFAARAIEAAIRNHPARIVAHVDGYAASAASFVAVACDEVEIAPGGFFMIHKAWTFTAGNADDLLHTAEMLDKLDASLVDTYAKKTGCAPEAIAGWRPKRGFPPENPLNTVLPTAWPKPLRRHRPTGTFPSTPTLRLFRLRRLPSTLRTANGTSVPPACLP